MNVYLRAKLQVCRVTLTSFRQWEGGEGGNFTPPSPPPQNEPLKSPPKLGLRKLFANFDLTIVKVSIFR